MQLQVMAKWIFILGISLLVLSAILFLLSKTSLPLGKLPGDISYKGDKTSFHFPVVTCIVISVVLTIVINILLWLFRK